MRNLIHKTDPLRSLPHLPRVFPEEIDRQRHHDEAAQRQGGPDVEPSPARASGRQRIRRRMVVECPHRQGIVHRHPHIRLSSLVGIERAPLVDGVILRVGQRDAPAQAFRGVQARVGQTAHDIRQQRRSINLYTDHRPRVELAPKDQVRSVAPVPRMPALRPRRQIGGLRLRRRRRGVGQCLGRVPGTRLRQCLIRQSRLSVVSRAEANARLPDRTGAIEKFLLVVGRRTVEQRINKRTVRPQDKDLSGQPFGTQLQSKRRGVDHDSSL